MGYCRVGDKFKTGLKRLVSGEPAEREIGEATRVTTSRCNPSPSCSSRAKIVVTQL